MESFLFQRYRFLLYEIIHKTWTPHQSHASAYWWVFQLPRHLPSFIRALLQNINENVYYSLINHLIFFLRFRRNSIQVWILSEGICTKRYELRFILWFNFIWMKINQCLFCHTDHLNNHRNQHTGQSLHKCGYCSKSFSRKEHLKNHQVKHTGISPYQVRKKTERLKLDTVFCRRNAEINSLFIFSV